MEAIKMTADTDNRSYSVTGGQNIDVEFEEKPFDVTQAVVWVVDDDPDMRASLTWLLESAGYSVKAYSKPTELLDHYEPDCPGCFLLDLILPEMNGLQLWQALHERGSHNPFLIVSGQADVTTAVTSMHHGAVDFIEKPFKHTYLFRRVELALQRDALERRRRLANADFHTLLDSLTPREREVMQFVTEGMLTKQIALRLDISEKTVEVHRSHVTKKMKVQSVAQLVRLVTKHTLA